ncbi:MAG: hypothetical protein U5J98_07010 [Halobacteriales archaeon]|nr:hypothetical protein [Halobacteriales archaeon]
MSADLPEPGSRECPRVGIDQLGHTHYHDDEGDRMLLTNAGDVVEVHDLDGRPVEQWISHVREHAAGRRASGSRAPLRALANGSDTQ